MRTEFFSFFVYLLVVQPKTVINGTAPEVDPDLCQPLSLSWQPGDGTFIAVPDRNQQVLFLDRDTFKSMKENERLTVSFQETENRGH